MASVSQVARSLKHILEERANVLARETGCMERQRKFSGADLLQTLVFGWLSHPDAQLSSSHTRGPGDGYSSAQTLYPPMGAVPARRVRRDDPCDRYGRSGGSGGAVAPL
jgi:hypothetical protein